MVRRRSSEAKNMMEASANVLSFLNMLGLSRIIIRKGRMVCYNVKLRCFIITFIFLSIDIFCAKLRLEGAASNLAAVTEVLSSIVTWAQLLYTMISVNALKPEFLHYNFNLIQETDAVLGIDTGRDYENDRRTMNGIFFTLTFIRVPCGALEQAAWIHAQSLQSSWPHISEYVIFLYSYTYCTLYISKLYILQKRISKMHLDITSSLVAQRDGSHTASSEDKVKKLKLCYMKMAEYTNSLNTVDGLQVLLTYSNIMVYLVSIIHTSNEVYTQIREIGTYIYIVFAAIIRVVMEFSVIVTTLVLARNITQNVQSIHNCVQNYLVTNSRNKQLSEGSRQVWTEFAELVHRNPLVFTAYDFFPLDYSLLVAMFATILTYTTILTQLN